MIEKRHALGDVKRMMKRHADDGRPEPNAVRERRCFRQRHLGRRHRFPATGVMLADEKLVEADLVGVADQLDVARTPATDSLSGDAAAS
jgi:hypothetical protein